MRTTDKVRLALIVASIAVVTICLVVRAFAQTLPTQDYINGTTAALIAAQGIRIDNIERMINAVLVALVINFIAQIVQIRRQPQSRIRWEP